MLDYMCALQQQFFEEPECTELRHEIKELHQQLVQSQESHKQVLKLLDLEDALKDEISLASFAAGFQLAWEITKEMGKPYSFLEEEEQRASRAAQERRSD